MRDSTLSTLIDAKEHHLAVTRLLMGGITPESTIIERSPDITTQQRDLQTRRRDIRSIKNRFLFHYNLAKNAKTMLKLREGSFPSISYQNVDGQHVFGNSPKFSAVMNWCGPEIQKLININLETVGQTAAGPIKVKPCLLANIVNGRYKTARCTAANNICINCDECGEIQDSIRDAWHGMTDPSPSADEIRPFYIKKLATSLGAWVNHNLSKGLDEDTFADPDHTEHADGHGNFARMINTIRHQIVKSLGIDHEDSMTSGGLFHRDLDPHDPGSRKGCC